MLHDLSPLLHRLDVFVIVAVGFASLVCISLFLLLGDLDDKDRERGRKDNELKVKIRLLEANVIELAAKDNELEAKNNLLKVKDTELANKDKDLAIAKLVAVIAKNNELTVKKSNAKVSQHKQKRASKNKLRLADKPHLSKQQRQEAYERFMLTNQIIANNAQLVKNEMQSAVEEKSND